MSKTPDESPTTADAAHDKAYRLGWEQAWREWSACISAATPFHPAQISEDDLARMEARLREMESYGR